jgi:predicted dehydrogenase
MVHVGFIGLGVMGLQQVTAFAQVKGCRIVAGADPSDSARAALLKQAPDAAVFDSYHAMLKSGLVDAVVVCVPTGLHREVATDVMRSGRPVLLEKPAARTVGECRKLLAESERTRQLCMVAHCRRYDPDWLAVAKVVGQGTLGRPVIWRDLATVKGPRGWFMDDRLGGGPLLDGAVHNYDFANLLFGEPVQVVGSGIQLTSHTAVDTATAIVHYAGGDQLVMAWSWAGTATGARVREIQGPRGALTFGPGPLASPDLDTRKHVFHCLTQADDPRHKLIRSPRKCMYVEQARHFLACLAERETCRTPLSEALKAVAVGEAVLKVARKPGITAVRW